MKCTRFATILISLAFAGSAAASGNHHGSKGKGKGHHGKGHHGKGHEHMFTKLDTNKDNKVSKDEFLAHFNTVDTNKNGFLEKEEMAAHHATMRAKMKGKR